MHAVTLNFTSKDHWELVLCRIQNARALYQSSDTSHPTNQAKKGHAVGWIDNGLDELTRALSENDLPAGKPVERDNVARPHSIQLTFEDYGAWLTCFDSLYGGKALYQIGLDENRQRTMDKAMSDNIEPGLVSLVAAIHPDDLPAGNESAKP